MAEKQTNKERLKDITDSIETGIKELFESDRYRQYLATMSRFHRYSVNNTMLIYMQRPDATHVAGFNKWRDQFGRSVKKGEKGIKIIAPTPFKKKIEQQKLDPDTKLPLRDENGDIITEEKTVQIPMYRPVVVFDVQQTAGKPLPELAANLTGDVQNYEVFMEALRRSAPVPIFFEKLASASSVEIGSSFDVPDSVTAVTHSARIFIPLDDLVDKEKELARLAKEKAAVQKDIDFSQGKLNNPGFMAKAPEKQVEAEKAKLAKALDKMAKIEQSIAAFSK